MITSCLTFIFSSSLVYEFHSCRYFMSCNCIPSTKCVVDIVPPLSHVGLFVTPWIAACQTSPVLHYLLEFVQTHVHWVGDAIQPSHPLSSPSPFAFNLSQQQNIFNESALHIRWPKNWSFNFSISPSNVYWDWLVWSPCSPWGSQESSPAPQYGSINSEASIGNPEWIFEIVA